MIEMPFPKNVWDEWVVPKKNDWGYELKPGAPENVRKEFYEYDRAVKAEARALGYGI